jgi:very-short-patch-repair endonuclease
MLTDIARRDWQIHTGKLKPIEKTIEKIANYCDIKQKALNYRKKLIDNATKPELIIKRFLKSRKIGFTFQAIVFTKKQKKFYILDFLLFGKGIKRKNLAIEIDGKQHYTDKAINYDLNRESDLFDLKIETIRISNSDIRHHFDKVEKLLSEYIDNCICIDNKENEKR